MSSSSTHNNKIEDYVGDAKINNEQGRKNKYVIVILL